MTDAIAGPSARIEKQTELVGGVETFADIYEVARSLAVSWRTVHRWTQAGQLPSYKIGRTRRYLLSEVRRSLEKNNRTASLAEVLL